MKRTQEEIQTIIDNVEAELARLPDINGFGDSNAETKGELQGWVRDLRSAQAGGPVKDDNVKIWLEGRWSELEDYK